MPVIRLRISTSSEPAIWPTYSYSIGIDSRWISTVVTDTGGGAAGAAIGSKVDKDDGRTAAIVGGAIIGVLVGGAIGQYMDSVDQNCIGQTLEHVPDGETIVWRNPDNGGAYHVTPAETYRQADGRYCREYVTEILIEGRRQQAYGTACR